jgi:hypothetical protein
MSMILVKKGTSDEFSIGDGSDPIDVGAVNLDDTNSPTTEESTVLNFEILASTYNYTALGMSILNEDTGINYELSITSAVAGFSDTVTPIDMDATGGDVRQDIWVKTIVDNDGSVAAGAKAVPDIQLTGTENQ